MHRPFGQSIFKELKFLIRPEAFLRFMHRFFRPNQPEFNWQLRNAVLRHWLGKRKWPAFAKSFLDSILELEIQWTEPC